MSIEAPVPYLTEAIVVFMGSLELQKPLMQLNVSF